MIVFFVNYTDLKNSYPFIQWSYQQLYVLFLINGGKYMTIVWTGPLALVLNRISRVKTPIKIHRFRRYKTNQVKRVGIYYMCIDDLFN